MKDKDTKLMTGLEGKIENARVVTRCSHLDYPLPILCPYKMFYNTVSCHYIKSSEKCEYRHRLLRPLVILKNRKELHY